MKVEFVKMNGCGNSQIIVDAEDVMKYVESDGLNLLAKTLLDEHFGIGADQMLLCSPPSSGVDADAQMRIFNKDGSEVEMCGNGIRCMANHVYDTRAMIREELRIETPLHVGNEVKTVKLYPDTGHVKVDMGIGKYSGRLKLNINGEINVGYKVNVGNPHFVIFTADASKELALSAGPGIENFLKEFPEKTNVEFVKIKSRSNVDCYVWERGSGYTYACGTGATAVAYAGYEEGILNNKCAIGLPGGILDIEIKGDNLYLTGPVTQVGTMKMDYSDLEYLMKTVDGFED